MRVVIKPSAVAVADFVANTLINGVREQVFKTLGLATGSTPLPVYQRLVDAYRENRISFADVSTFNLDEYLGLPASHLQSYRYFMDQHLFSQTDFNRDNTFVPDGMSTDPIHSCEDYEQEIRRRGGIDVQLLGIGRNGHIGFNEPGSSLASRTRVKTLTEQTIRDNARFFKPDEMQPHLALTMGIGTILDAKHILLLACGDGKAGALKQMLEGPVSSHCPASALQFHSDVCVVADEAAAAKLEQRDFYLHVEKEHQQFIARYYT